MAVNSGMIYISNATQLNALSIRVILVVCFVRKLDWCRHSESSVLVVCGCDIENIHHLLEQDRHDFVFSDENTVPSLSAVSMVTIVEYENIF